MSNRKKPARGNFKFSTNNADAGKFLRRFAENLNFMVNDEATHGVQLQKCLEHTCADELKKILPPRARRSINHFTWKGIHEEGRTGRSRPNQPGKPERIAFM